MLPHEHGWPVAIVPLQVGVLQFPIPTARRCFALGRSLRKAILSFPEDLKVAIVGSGGLSHQVSGERAGFNNTDWDMEFLELLEKDPEKLTELSIADYAKRGGIEGAEVVMWLVMRGALTPKVRKVHQSYAIPTMTATATVIYEDLPEADETASVEAYAAKARREYDGVAEHRRLLPVHARSQQPGRIASTSICTASFSPSCVAGSSTIGKART